MAFLSHVSFTLRLFASIVLRLSGKNQNTGPVVGRAKNRAPQKKKKKKRTKKENKKENKNKNKEKKKLKKNSNCNIMPL